MAAEDRVSVAGRVVDNNSLGQELLDRWGTDGPAGGRMLSLRWRSMLQMRSPVHPSPTARHEMFVRNGLPPARVRSLSA